MAQNFSATGMPPMIGKMLSINEWLSYVAEYEFTSLKPTKVVLHHTWRPTVAQWSGLSTMQGMQKYYAGKGWTAAPHIYVGPDGIWLFTPLRDIGIHANAGNGSRAAGWYSIGVEMVGDYDHVRPSGAIWEATKAVLGGLSRKLAIAPQQLLSFHREYNNTKSCPGWAITKDWVFAEVNGWLASQAAPDLPVGLIGSPTPDVEHLAELILDQSYLCRAEGYNESWAFHLFAFQNNLGFPLARSQRFDLAGKSYNFQTFARDTLFCEIPNWGDVQRLSELLAGSIPPAGTLGYGLLEASYRSCGATLHPDWAFHQYALASSSTSAPLGPPLQESKTLTLDGVSYSYQIFATDTLYNRGTDWASIARLSGLANTSDAGQIRLRDALLKLVYAASGLTYHPEWAFHQMARMFNMGAPLAGRDPVTMGSAQYNFQVYATDTVYNVIPNWSDVKRLSEIMPRRQAMLSGENPRARSVGALLSSDTVYDPKLKEHYIVRYHLPAPSTTAASLRGRRSKIEMLILHGDQGPAERSLAAMTVVGSSSLVHYYVAHDGQIYQLISDRYAARHAGMALWDGKQRNLNNISLGIAVELHGHSLGTQQQAALNDLIASLRKHYHIPAKAVRRWNQLRSGVRDGLEAKLLK